MANMTEEIANLIVRLSGDISAFQDSMESAVVVATSTAAAVSQTTQQVVNKAADALTQVPNRVTAWLTDIATKISDTLSTLILDMAQEMLNDVKAMLDTLDGVFGGLPSKVAGMLNALGQSVAQRLAQVLTNAAQYITSRATQIVSSAVPVIARVSRSLAGTLQNVVQQVNRTMVSVTSVVLQTARTAVDSIRGIGAASLEFFMGLPRAVNTAMAQVHASFISTLDALEARARSTGRTLSFFLTTPLLAKAGLAVRSFAQDEKAIKSLEAALMANHRPVEMLSNRYQRLAADIEKTTTVSGSQVLALLKQAEVLGQTGHAAERAARNAISLEKAFGVSSYTAMQMTAALEEGRTSMLLRYIPSLRNIEGKSERAAEALRHLADMFKIANEETKSFSGVAVQTANAVGNAWSQFGQIIAQAVVPYMKMTKEAAEWFSALSEEAKKTIVVLGGLTAALGPVIYFKARIIGALKIALGLFAMINTPIGLVVASIGALTAALISNTVGWDNLLSTVKSLATSGVGFITHFSENMKILMSWLQDNWKDIFTTMGKVAESLFFNLVHNATVAAKAAFRVFIAFQGWMTKLWTSVFSTDFINAVYDGIKKSLKAMVKFSQQAWETMKAAFTGGADELNFDSIFKGIQSDFDAGFAELNFFKTIQDIMTEEMANMKGLLDGFQTDLKMPEFNLKLESDIKKKNPFQHLIDMAHNAWDTIRGIYDEWEKANRKVMDANVAVTEGSSELFELVARQEGVLKTSRSAPEDRGVMSKPGDQVVQGLLGGIKSGINSLVTLTQKELNKATAGLKVIDISGEAG